MKKSINILEPLVRKERPIPEYAVFDIESNNWKDLVVLGFYDGRRYKDYGDMLEFLLDITNMDELGRIPDDLTIFAHNGGAFDFNFVLQCVIKESGRKHFKINNVLPRGSSFLSIELTRVYGKDQDGMDIEGPTLIFRDSLAILPFSLRQLTDSFKTECAKGEWDHKNDFKYRDDPRLLEYLKADCVGLYQVLQKYFNSPIIRQSGVSFTVASQALKVFRTTLKTKINGCSTFAPPGLDSVDSFVRKGYFGGRTEVFRPYYCTTNPVYFNKELLKENPKEWDRLMEESDDKISCWDVNSLYPSVMRDFEYPTNFKKWSFKYDPKSFGFWEAEVEVPKDMYVPPLGTLIHIDNETKEVTKVADSSKGKFIFPTGRFSGVWSTIELEYAKSVGVKVLKTGKGAIFENGGYIFKDFITELYEMRMKAEKDSVDSFICKLIMNSSYGRFGLNLERDQLVIDEGQEGVKESCYEFETGDTIDGKPVLFRFVREKKKIESFTNVAIAAWVTAHARIRMHKQYHKYQKHLYYTDTDSIFVKHDRSMPDSKLLGEFKYEYSAAEGCFLLPKTYALAGITGMKDKKGQFIRTKAVIKGINREALKMRGVSVQDLHNMLEGDFKRAHIGPIDPLIFDIEPKFAKVRTAMRKGTFLHVNPGQKRQVKAKYDKRTIFVTPEGLFDTVPVHIWDNKALNYRGGEVNVKIKNKKGKKTLTISGDILIPNKKQLKKSFKEDGFKVKIKK